MTLQPGLTLGRYQILGPIGAGGMATVYKAFQPSLEREVALKVLRPGLAEDPEFFQRFQREARSIARLRHPNIVQVFDFEPVDGRYVLAMEFLEGGTLKERLTSLARNGERMSRDEIGRIVNEVATALAYAHRLGIIHRDVKPSNVMLTEGDRAVVTDFGIARIVGSEGQTKTGVGVGTPEYMAPEQATGNEVDQRADIYSLGVMSFEMLTGRVPYKADTPLAIVLAHLRDPVPLARSVDPTVAPSTEHVLLKALAKDPADRYASAVEFSGALVASLADVSDGATLAPVLPLPTATWPQRLRRMPPALMAAVGVGVLASAGGVAMALGVLPGVSLREPVAQMTFTPPPAPTRPTTVPATATPSPQATPTPTPGPTAVPDPPFNAAIVPRGPLLFNGTAANLQREASASDGVRFVVGAGGLDITIDLPRREGVLSVPVQIPADYVADIEVRLPPNTPRANVHWTLRQDEDAALQFMIAGSTAQVMYGAGGVPGVPVGPRFSVAPSATLRLTVSMRGNTIRMVREGVTVLEFEDERTRARPLKPYIYFQSQDETGTSTMRLVALRYYAAP